MLTAITALAVLGSAQADTAVIFDLCTSECTLRQADITNALIGAGATDVTITSSASGLGDHRMMIVGVPFDNWNDELHEAVVDHGASGKPLLLMLDNGYYFEDANARITDVLVDLGLSSRIQILDTWDGESGCVRTFEDVNSGHPLMDGVNWVGLNWHTALSACASDTLLWNETDRAALAYSDKDGDPSDHSDAMRELAFEAQDTWGDVIEAITPSS